MPDGLRNPKNSPGSLTQPDLVTLERLVHSMVSAGLWVSAERSGDASCDCFDIATYDLTGTALSIGVLASGRYFYMDHRSSAVRLGADLEDLLEQTGLSVD